MKLMNLKYLSVFPYLTLTTITPIADYLEVNGNKPYTQLAHVVRVPLFAHIFARHVSKVNS